MARFGDLRQDATEILELLGGGGAHLPFLLFLPFVLLMQQRLALGLARISRLVPVPTLARQRATGHRAFQAGRRGGANGRFVLEPDLPSVRVGVV